jgi:uncharacterized protein YdeI (YjbR/CyaY-like superfamily)
VNDGLPIVLFETAQEWAGWLAENHASAPGIWLRIAKKAGPLDSVSYDEALDAALCYGWIDGQRKSLDDVSFLQKFTRRGPRSIWSKRNTEKAQALIRSRRMQRAGLKEVERAKEDGRWDAAYEGQARASIPPDLQAALDRNAKAKAFFATLDSRNRYAVLFRLQTAKKPETRAKRLQQFVRMLAAGETFYP